ncbi:MAG: hypothetical protein J7559_19965 [Cohnella sp.]|nr:hypothetical protein [Cohnella sp.]
MWKKAGILAFALMLIVTTVEASTGAIKATIFNVSIYLNNQKVQLNDNSPLLSYNGKTYAPLRDLSYAMVGYVGYVGYDNENH